MSKENDEKIIKLKQKVEEKRKALKDTAPKFEPITNCRLDLDGMTYNLHTLTKRDIIPILVKLTIYESGAKSINLIDDYSIGNYHISDWITDLNAKLEKIKFEDSKKELNDLEKKLTTMLSSDKQVELEIDKIAELLN